MTVQLHAFDIEGNTHPRADAVTVECRKVAEDAVLDAVVLDIHRNILAHGDDAVRCNADVAVEARDAFLRHGDARQHQQQCGQKNAAAADQEKDTFGTARSAASSIWKNAACLNPNEFAMMFDG